MFLVLDPDVSEETDYTDTDSELEPEFRIQELDPGFHTIPGCLKAKSSCDPRGKPTCCGTCVVDAREGKKGFVCDPRTKMEIMRDARVAMRGKSCPHYVNFVQLGVLNQSAHAHC